MYSKWDEPSESRVSSLTAANWPDWTESLGVPAMQWIEFWTDEVLKSTFQHRMRNSRSTKPICHRLMADDRSYSTAILLKTVVSYIYTFWPPVAELVLTLMEDAFLCCRYIMLFYYFVTHLTSLFHPNKLIRMLPTFRWICIFNTIIPVTNFISLWLKCQSEGRSKSSMMVKDQGWSYTKCVG